MLRKWSGAIAVQAFVISLAVSPGGAIAQVPAEPVKLGVLDDMSGPYAENSGQGNVLAVRMAIKDFGGTMFGKPIELVSGDLQNKVDIGMAIARKWFDIEHVDAILGMGSS